MQISKDMIVKFLEDQGRHDDAQRANNELPNQVDHEKDAGLLAKFGIDPQELLAKLPGGLGDKLGGLLGDK